MQAQFTHDCTGDTLVAIIQGVADIYKQCGGAGYIVRYGNDGPDYSSFVGWTLADALRAAANLCERTPR